MARLKAPSPSCVLFDSFKAFGGISNRTLGSVVLTDKNVGGDRSPRERIYTDKTFLSRQVVHAQPGDLFDAYFVNFAESSYTLYSMLRSSEKQALDARRIAEYFSGEGARAMAAACRSYGLDANLYSNTANRLLLLEGIGQADRAYLLLMLFVATGCLQDPRRAAQLVLQHSESYFNSAPVTQTAESYQRAAEADPAPAEDVRLALFRVRGSRISGAPHVLSIGPKGTEIGYLSTAENSITDVEQTVSRRHLLIFRDDEGLWWARGLGSRNGTVLISGHDRCETVVEPPRSKAAGFEPFDVAIAPGDKLVLARDTIFMVMQVDASAN